MGEPFFQKKVKRRGKTLPLKRDIHEQVFGLGSSFCPPTPQNVADKWAEFNQKMVEAGSRQQDTKKVLMLNIKREMEGRMGWPGRFLRPLTPA